MQPEAKQEEKKVDSDVDKDVTDVKNDAKKSEVQAEHDVDADVQTVQKDAKTTTEVAGHPEATAEHVLRWSQQLKKSRKLPNSGGWINCDIFDISVYF